ncbi:MAG TPA: ammonium transporter [Actinomycetota bacterium]|nr:ammonium transporter [Actinomycetota bacterium]
MALTALPAFAAQESPVDTGDTAWILTSAALVMFMTPGLAFFYGGLVRQKNVLGTIMHSFMALGIVTVLWVAIGHTLAFGPDIGKVIGDGGWLGGLDFLGFKDVGGDPNADLAATIPHMAYGVYQMMFAVITPALIAGAYAERIKFSAYLAFTALWVVVVYAPVAHWVWGLGMLNGLNGLGALDFAGGTVVHQNAGIAALAFAIVLGRRKGYPGDSSIVPHNVPFVVLGASILWFGWFGFNGGSALASGGLAALAFTNTHAATAAAVFGWIIPEWIQHRKPTTVGAATGAVAGLVAITPASGYVRPWSSLIIGFAAGFLCYFAVSLKRRFNYDDALDVVGVHYVGGLIGALLTGIFATEQTALMGQKGLVYGGGLKLLGQQAAASAITTVWSLVVSLIILVIINAVIGLRVTEEDETTGLDLSQHGEAGYTMAGA